MPPAPFSMQTRVSRRVCSSTASHCSTCFIRGRSEGLSLPVRQRTQQCLVAGEQGFELHLAGVVASRIDLHGDDLALVQRRNRRHARMSDEEGLDGEKFTNALDILRGNAGRRVLVEKIAAEPK